MPVVWCSGRTKYLRTNVSFGFETAFVNLCVLILKSKPEIAVHREWCAVDA